MDSRARPAKKLPVYEDKFKNQLAATARGNRKEKQSW